MQSDSAREQEMTRRQEPSLEVDGVLYTVTSEWCFGRPTYTAWAPDGTVAGGGTDRFTLRADIRRQLAWKQQAQEMTR
jgi:hypothetical protein